MTKAFLDETEKDGLFLLGGFLGNCAQWDDLEKAWDETRKGKRIHLSAMRKNRSSAALLKNLGSLPCSAGLTPYYVSVRPSDYKDMLKTDGEKLAFEPYIVCLPMLLRLIDRRIPKEESIKFAFERNDRYDAHACAIFEESEKIRTSEGKARFASWEFFATEACPLLQTADYFIYAQRERLNNPNSPEAVWSSPILNADPKGAVKWEFGRDVIRKVIAANLAGGCDFGTMMSSYLKEIRRARHPRRQR